MGSPESEAQVKLSGEQDQAVKSLSEVMRVAGTVFLALAGFRLVAGVVAFAHQTIESGLLSLAQGALMGVLGLILWTGATDAQLIVDVKKYNKAHLLNTVQSLTDYCKMLLVLGLLLAVWLGLRLLF